MVERFQRLGIFRCLPQRFQFSLVVIMVGRHLQRKVNFIILTKRYRVILTVIVVNHVFAIIFMITRTRMTLEEMISVDKVLLEVRVVLTVFRRRMVIEAIVGGRGGVVVPQGRAGIIVLSCSRWRRW